MRNSMLYVLEFQQIYKRVLCASRFSRIIGYYYHYDQEKKPI